MRNLYCNEANVVATKKTVRRNSKAIVKCIQTSAYLGKSHTKQVTFDGIRRSAKKKYWMLQLNSWVRWLIACTYVQAFVDQLAMVILCVLYLRRKGWVSWCPQIIFTFIRNWPLYISMPNNPENILIKSVFSDITKNLQFFCKSQEKCKQQ